VVLDIGAYIGDTTKIFVDKALERNKNTMIGVTAFSSAYYNKHDLSTNEWSLRGAISSIYVLLFSKTKYAPVIHYSVDKLVSQGREGSIKSIIFLKVSRLS